MSSHRHASKSQMSCSLIIIPGQVYSIADSPLCLTGTAEVPLAGLHMDAILPGEALPLRLAAFGRAFRTEAGAAGAASRGLYRLHQFSKARKWFVLPWLQICC